MSNETKSSGSCIANILGFNSFLRRNSRSRNVRPISNAKTAWPVSYIESIFFPEFKKKSQVTDYEFKIVDTISKGAFGKVYKVYNGNTEYALKILSKAQIIADNALKQVKDEVQIQSMCGHHPFIVSCPYYWQTKKQLFIVTSFIPGGELLQLWCNYGSFPENVVKIYIAEIALALDFLHNAGVIYRDLKLENILLDPEGHIQIIDFGLAKWLKYGSHTSTICGTLQYMAPEILRMEPYSHSVDWWSLGVIAFCLLQGSRPFDGSAVSDNPSDGSFNVPSLSSDHSTAAKDLICRLLNPDPIKRLHSLYNLQGTAFFHKFNFKEIQERKVSPLMALKAHYPNGPSIEQHTETMLTSQAEKIESF